MSEPEDNDLEQIADLVSALEALLDENLPPETPEWVRLLTQEIRRLTRAGWSANRIMHATRQLLAVEEGPPLVEVPAQYLAPSLVLLRQHWSDHGILAIISLLIVREYGLRPPRE